MTLLAGDNGAITAAMITNDTALAIGTAGIEVAQQLFLKCKIKGKHVNLFDEYPFGKYAVRGPSCR